MQGQGNYSAPQRQGPYTNAPPFQQYGSLPPPPPPISQGPRLTRPSVAQQGWPQVGPLRPSVYPNASHGIQQQRPYLNSNLPSHPSQPLSVGTSQMQQHSHSSASFIPSTGLPSAPRVLPPPPSLGQTPFGNQVHQQAPPPPNHNTARFYASAPVGTFDPLMPSSSAPTRLPPPPPPPLAPPPPPEGPPIPSSSPPSNLSSGISKTSDHGGTGPNVVSTHDDGSSSDLPPAPPKPADDKIARTIELLCQFIAKNGPEFENMTRLKQRENPEFKFLFGAEPGSEAAIAHKYYMWTRRKYKLEYSSAETRGTSDSPLRQSGEFSSHHSFTTDQGLPCSPADSDMDMEDDITHPSGEPQSFSSEKQNHETISSSSGLERKQEVQPSLTSVDTGITKDDVDGNQSELQHSEPGSGEQREGKPSAEIDGLDTRSFGDDELPVHLSKADSTHESLGNPCTPVELAEIRLKTVPNLHGEQGGSYFRLLPDYESDRSSGDEDQPTTVIPSVGVGSSSHHMDERVDLGRDCDTERVAEPDKGLECPAQSSKLSSVVVALGKDFIAGESEDVVDNRYDNQESLRDDIPDEPCQFVFSKDDEMKDPKDVSSSLKVDEFGRLIRENNSDSEDDSPRYSRRKRGRSRSRSRSPQDRRRRRSPRRRNDMRSRSRSSSPKRRRSRSKSPPPARHGVPARRDKRGVCFNFVNGKHCYRGASCRYLHQDDESDRSRSRWGRQQFHDSPRTSGVHERSDMPHKKLFSEGKNLDRKHYDDSAITEDKKCLKAAVDGTAVNISEKDGDLEPSVHLQNGDQQHQQVEICSSFTSQLPKDGTHLNDEPVSQLCDNTSPTNKTDESRTVSEEPVVHKESVLPAPDHPANLMLPVFPSAPQPRNSNLAPSAATVTPNQASYPPSQFSFSPNQPWNSLPPPPPVSYPPRPVFGNDTFLPPRPPHGGATGKFALNIHPPRNDYFSQTPVRPYVIEFQHPSNVGQNQGYHYLQEQNRPQGNLDDHQQKTSVASKPVMDQSHGPGSEGSLFSQSQPLPVPEDSISKKRSYPGEIPPLAGGIYAPQGEHVNQNSSLPTYASGHDRNQPLMLSNLGVPMIRNHFNPYASTFEQPLGVTTLSQNHAEGRAPPNLSSVHPVEGVLPERGGDQYDPLCDSLEPSVNASSKSHYGQKHEITNESDDILRFSGCTKPLDGEETMQKMGGASEISGSFENDEFGETADAEVGAVENGSPSNLLQVNSPGKSKESRSMKPFKVAIASFVKEVLKPSWRQGNMSKEAFKTIVKKTVDRVSGAMKSHQIPRSQAKINHYIDSSQRKLTKLVMGYVDKYVKV